MAKVKEMNVEAAEQHISEEQLTKLQGIVKELNMLQGRIGELESQKYDLLAAVKTGREMLEGVQKELQEEYGDITINIETGAITEDAGNS